MGCHQRGSCWVRDHFLKLHPGSASRSFSPASAIFLMDLMELITAGRLMQRRPHSHSAAGHSSGINHAPTRHHCLSIVWGRAAPLCSASLSPPCNSQPSRGIPGDEGDACRCLGRSWLSSPGYGEAAASGGAEDPAPSPCPAQLGAPAAWG